MCARRARIAAFSAGEIGSSHCTIGLVAIASDNRAIMGRGVAGGATCQLTNTRCAGASSFVAQLAAAGRTPSPSAADADTPPRRDTAPPRASRSSQCSMPRALLDGEDAAVHLVLALHLQPLVVLVVREIGGQRPRQPLDSRFARLDARLDQPRLHLARQRRQIALFACDAAPAASVHESRTSGLAAALP